MIIYAEMTNSDGLYEPVRLDVRPDKNTDYTLIVDTVIGGDNGGPSFRLTSDQAAKLLAEIARVLE